MHSLTNLAALVVVAASYASAGSLPHINVKQALPLASGKVIVELNAPSDTSNFAKRDVHAALFEQMDRRGVRWETNAKFESDIFSGVSLTLSNPADIAHIQSLGEVKSVRPIRSYDRPRPVEKTVLKGANDPNVPQGDTLSTHVMTGVDKLHARNIKGKGIKVGIIDSGIDYTHPALGGSFGKNAPLVIGGYDYVGDKYDSQTNPVPVPDNDPLDQCGGHGTHVAGIIAAQPNNPYNITGVAYEAKLFAYRIFGCEGSTDDDVIVKALLQADKDGCDVITLSLGGPDGWSESTGSVVASRLASKGRVVTIAAGNEGATGSWYTSSPGNGIDVISVASVDNTLVYYNSLKFVGADHAPVPYISDGSLTPFNVTGEWPLYFTSQDSTIANDACDELPDSTPDLSKFITVIRRGTCNFTVKLENAAAKGAKAVIVYNNGNVFAGVQFGNATQAVIIDTQDGQDLFNAYKANNALKVTFPQSNAGVQVKAATGGLTSDYSTMGPTNEMYFKPAVAAPGGNILATWPVPLGAYAVLSGTSMATPHTAAVAALILQSKGRTAAVAKNMRTLMQTTSTTIPADSTEGAAPQTLIQAGSGLVNAANAVDFKTVLSTGQLTLNDTAHWKGQQSFTIKNGGSKKVTYKLTHVPAGTAITIDKSTGLAAVYPVPQTKDAATVKLSQTSVTVQPGKTVTIKATFTAPKGLDAKSFPVVSGHIQVTGNGEILKVSYMGAVASLKDAMVLDGSAAFFGMRTPQLLNATGDIQTESTSYTLGTLDSGLPDAPAILFRMAFGTPKLTVDLVSKDLHTPVTHNPPKNLLPVKKMTADLKYADVKTIGRVGTIEYMSRDNEDPEKGYETIVLPETFENGKKIAPGEYRLLLRAQHISSDPKLEASYDIFMSDSFKIVSKKA